jgi:hypothetical protein
VPANVPVCALKSVDGAKPDLITRLTEAVRDGPFDVAVGELTRDNRLRFHRRWLVACPARNRLRSLLK